MEVIEGTATRVEDAPGGWAGDFPFFLVIEPNDKTDGNIGIDLDESGWLTTYAKYMRMPGAWFLYHKGSGSPVMCVIVEDGDQPYFTRHTVGNLMAGGMITTVGIGKKNRDGSVTRLWLFPNGLFCGGDDVDVIASRMMGG